MAYYKVLILGEDKYTCGSADKSSEHDKSSTPNSFWPSISTQTSLNVLAFRTPLDAATSLDDATPLDDDSVTPHFFSPSS